MHEYFINCIYVYIYYVDLLFKGGAALDLNSVEPKAKKWITDMTWLNLVEISKLAQFSQVLRQIGKLFFVCSQR